MRARRRSVRHLLAALAFSIGIGEGVAGAKGEGGGASAACLGFGTLYAYAVVQPEADGPLVVATNFGLLVSRDGGETFGWVCPAAFGAQYAPNLTVFALPGVSVVPDGKVVVLTGDVGYWISDEEVCGFRQTPDSDLGHATVVAVASRDATQDTVLAAVSWPGRGPFGVYRSQDGADDFVASTLSADAADARFDSLSMRGDGEVAYAAGRAQPGNEVSFWRSDDGGQTWTEASTLLTATGTSLLGSAADDHYAFAYDAAAAPCDLRVTMLASRDGAETWSPLWTRDGLPVGAHVADDGLVTIGWADGGLETSSDGGQTFAPVDGSLTEITCGGVGPTGATFLCPIGSQDLVLTRDDATGSWEPLVSLDDVTGPLDCSPDATVSVVCTERWAELAAYWRLDTGPEVEPDGGPAVAGDHDGGCGCSTARGRAVPGVTPLLFALLIVARARRARRRTPAP